MSISKYQFAVYKRALPKLVCDRIINAGLRAKGDVATTFSTGANTLNDPDKLKELYSKRDSNISWLREPWVCRAITPYIEQARKEFEWNYEINKIESCQFTTYYPGQFYDWHQDSFVDRKIIEKHKGNNRKISASIILNDPSEYKGGDLEFHMRHKERPEDLRIEKNPFNDQGTIVIFPSFMYHRVLPVTEGVRYSLVMWIQGPDWR